MEGLYYGESGLNPLPQSDQLVFSVFPSETIVSTPPLPVPTFSPVSSIIPDFVDDEVSPTQLREQMINEAINNKRDNNNF
jgi:hypothetical protein